MDQFQFQKMYFGKQKINETERISKYHSIWWVMTIDTSVHYHGVAPVSGAG